MKLKTILILATMLILSVSAIAQKTEPVKPAKLPSAKEILDNYVKALGGREAIQKLKSRVQTGTLEFVPMNLKGTFEFYAAPETKTLMKMSISQIGDMLEGSDGKIAWSVNPIQGSREKAGAELAQNKLTNDFYRDLKLDQLFPRMEVAGIEKIGDREAYVIKATAEGLPVETWYFDTKTAFMLRSEQTAISPEAKLPLITLYEDMRTVDGVLIPHRLRVQTTQFTIVMTVAEVKHNVAIDEAKFAKPKQ